MRRTRIITERARSAIKASMMLLLAALTVLTLCLIGLAAIPAIDGVPGFNKVRFSAVWLTFYAACLLPIINAIARRRLRPLLWTGALGATAALLPIGLLVWFNWNWDATDRLTAWSVLLAALPIACVPISLLAVMSTDRTWLRVARWMVNGLCLLAAGLLMALMITLLIFEDDLTYASPRLMGVYITGMFATAISGGLGIATAPIVAALITAVNRRQREVRETIGRTIEVQITCPHCRSMEQFIANGRASACNACGRSVIIDLEEPRCECGYLLYQLRSETCPECGRAISASKRWGAMRRGTAEQEIR